MESVSLNQLLIFATVLSLICAVCTTLLTIISTKAAVASLPPSRQRTRLKFSTWIVTFIFFAATLGHSLMTNPAILGQAFSNQNEKQNVSPSPCTCLETNTLPSKQSSDPAPCAISPVAQNQSVPLDGAKFTISSIQYNSAPNALMGKFQGIYDVKPDVIKISIPNPIFRLAGVATTGARKITGIRIGVGTYYELTNIANGLEGEVDWSERYPLNVVRNNGQESAIDTTLDFTIPRKCSANLYGKTFIIEMNNEVLYSGQSFKPAYALGSKNILDGH